VARKFDSQAVAEILAKWNGLPSNANGKIGVSQLADEYGCSTRTILDIGKGKYLKRKNSISMKGKTLSDFPHALEMWNHEQNPLEVSRFSKLIPYTKIAATSKSRYSWICSEKHVWEQSVGNITRGDGCPFCSGRRATKENSLLVLRPDIAAEFHSERNGNLLLDELTIKSAKKVWWKCKTESMHEWQSSPANRTSKAGLCPYCSNQKTDHTNCMATTHPHIAELWHPTKNGEKKPEMYTAGSNHKFWWKCPEGPDHEWKTTPNNMRRETKSGGCPSCAGRQLSVSNSLVINFPELAAQWHPTKNGNWKVDDVKIGTQKGAWWKCSEGPDHEWITNVDMRTKQGTGCPYCAGKNASVTNSIASLHPHLIEEWHPTKNGEKTPKDFPAGSAHKVWWKCDKGPDHEWRTIIQTRTVRESGCPFCSHLKLSVTNSLQALNPEIASQWHPVKNGNLTPEDVVVGTKKRVWWKCPEGPDHEWKGSIGERAGTTRNCPFCENLRVSKTNSLQTVNPSLAKEWHPTKNGDLTPNDLVSGSGKKVWWKCPEGPDHEWETTPSHRRGNWATGCPFCFKKNQALVFQYVKEIFPSEKVLFDYKHPELKFLSGRKMELDIFIQSLSLGIEYQGEYHFEGFWGGRGVVNESQKIEQIQRRDQEKRDACKLVEIVLVEIPFTWDRSKEFVENALIDAGITI
jgi:hypothetical protein